MRVVVVSRSDEASSVLDLHAEAFVCTARVLCPGWKKKGVSCNTASDAGEPFNCFPWMIVCYPTLIKSARNFKQKMGMQHNDVRAIKIALGGFWTPQRHKGVGRVARRTYCSVTLRSILTVRQPAAPGNASPTLALLGTRTIPNPTQN